MSGARSISSSVPGRNPSISTSALANVVGMDTTRNGFVNGSGGITITVCRPGVSASCPTQYTYVAGAKAVKVTITQPKGTFFSGILGLTSMNIGVRSAPPPNQASRVTM